MQNIKPYISHQRGVEAYDSFAKDLIEIKNAIRNVIDSQNANAPSIKQILNKALAEIHAIDNGEYKINRQIDRKALGRILPHLENTRGLYALSVDTVSTFWADEHMHNDVKLYLEKQPQNTVRIFAFSSIREANRYKEILQANYERYGEHGAVLICSLNSCRAFISEMNPIHHSVNVDVEQDFALLKCGSGDKAYYVIGTMDESEFNISKIDCLSAENHYNSLVEAYDEMKKMNVTDLYAQNGIAIKKWNPEYLHDGQLWKKDLQLLFPDEIVSSVYHLVYFKDLEFGKEELLFEIKNDLLRILDTLKVQDIWFGKKTNDKPVNDDIFKAKLKINYEYDYLLIIKFLNYEDLRQYYSSDIHAIIRKKLYSRMNEGLGLIYQILDKRKIQETDQGKLFEKVIEELVSKHMMRQDYVELVDIESILLEKPYRFGLL